MFYFYTSISVNNKLNIYRIDGLCERKGWSYESIVNFYKVGEERGRGQGFMLYPPHNKGKWWLVTVILLDHPAAYCTLIGSVFLTGIEMYLSLLISLQPL